MEALPVLLDPFEVSDLTIISHGRSWKVSKDILIAKSPWFRRVLKDGEYTEIAIEDEKPDAVEAMLHYVYTSGIAKQATVERTLLLYLSLLPLARHFHLDGMMQAARSQFALVVMSGQITARDLAAVGKELYNVHDGCPVALKAPLRIAAIHGTLRNQDKVLGTGEDKQRAIRMLMSEAPDFMAALLTEAAEALDLARLKGQ